MQIPYSMFNSARNIWANLPFEQTYKLLSMSPLEQEMFKYFVASHVELKQKQIKTENELQSVKGQLSVIEQENNILKHSLRKINKEIKNIKLGWSFRIGRLITWLPRKLLNKK